MCSIRQRCAHLHVTTQFVQITIGSIGTRVTAGALECGRVKVLAVGALDAAINIVDGVWQGKNGNRGYAGSWRLPIINETLDAIFTFGETGSNVVTRTGL